MSNYNDATAANLFAQVTQLFRSLSKPAAPLAEQLQKAAPQLFATYTEEYPTFTSHQISQRLLEDLGKQVADQWPIYADFLQALLAGESVSVLARSSTERWGWSESTFYNRYRDARKHFTDYLREVEERAEQIQGKSAQSVSVDSPAPPEPGEPPFKGLHCFEIDDAARFFGREKLVQELVVLLNRHRFLAIVGASGSGKSSLVRAGVTAALQHTIPTLRDEHVTVYLMTPTVDPLRALAMQLIPKPHDITTLLAMRDGLAQDARYLDFYLAEQMANQPGHATKYILVIDQFEELFTLCSNPESRQLFVENVMTAFTHNVALSVVFTLRADFYAHCAEYEELRRALSRYQVYIGPMSSAELRKAIEKPAQLADWHFEAGLIDLLLQDIGQEPAALPLLSHALLETWRRREKRTMTLRGYLASGRVQGAIAQTADEIFQRRLLAEQRPIARNIFLRLTELGEGVPDTRRRVAFTELGSTTKAESTVAEVLQILTDARLVTTYQAEAEVAHEALIRQWPQLQLWLEEEREDLLIHRRLTEAAHDWVTSEHDPDLLYRGARLEQALDWMRRYPQDVNPLEHKYLLASERAVATARNESELRVRIARAGQLAALSQVVAQEPTARASSLPLMLAKAAVETTWIADGDVIIEPFVTVEADAALRSAIDAMPPWWMTLPRHRHTNKVTSLDFSPNGKWLATAGHDETIRIWDLETGHQKDCLVGHTNHVMSVRFSSDGSRLVSASKDATARIWDFQSGKELIQLCGHTAGVSHALFSPDDQQIATSSRDQTARLWNSSTGEEQACLQHQNELKTVTFHPTQAIVCTGCDDRIIRFWDLESAEEVQQLTGHTGSIYSVAFRSDGLTLVSSCWDGTARLWDIASGQELLRMSHPCPVFAASFSAAQTHVITACRDRFAAIWDLASGKEISRLLGHRDRVRTVGSSSDGRFHGTVSNDCTVRIWSAVDQSYLPLLEGHVDAVNAIALHTDGTLLVSASADGTLRLWNRTTGQQVSAWMAHHKGATCLSFSPNHRFIVSGGNDHVVRLWLCNDGTEVKQFSGHKNSITSVMFDAEGKFLATGSHDKTCRIWQVHSGKLQQCLTGHADTVTSVLFQSKEDLIATAGADHTIRFWRFHDGAESYQLRTQSVIVAMTFSSDGLLLAGAGDDGMVYVWNVTTGQILQTLKHNERPIHAIAFSGNDQQLLVGDNQGHALLWDWSATQIQMVFEGHTAPIYAVLFSHNGKRIVTAAADCTIRIWHAARQKQAITLHGHSAWVTAVTFSPNNQLVATAGMDQSILFYTTTDYSVVHRLKGHLDRIHSIAFDPTGTCLVSASKDKTARVWSVHTGEERLCLQGHGESVKAALFSPDSTRIVTGSNDGTVRLWDAVTGSELQIFIGHQADVADVAFHPDGQFVASASHDKTVRLWDIHTGEQIGLFRGHTGNVCSVAFSPDGQTIVTASDDETARLWDVKQSVEVACYRQHADIVWSAAFSQDGRYIVTASKDGAVRLWDVMSASCLRLLSAHTDEVLSVAFSPDGQRIISGSKDESAIVWKVAIQELLADARLRTQREPSIFTRDERLRFGMESN